MQPKNSYRLPWEKTQPNHLAIWAVAFFCALGLLAIVVALFYDTLHPEDSLPSGISLLALLFKLSLVFIFGWVISALILHRMGAFQKPIRPDEEEGWKARNQSPTLSIPVQPRLEILRREGNLVIHGELVLIENRLFFLGGRVESYAKLIGKQLLLSQLGPLGTLLQTLSNRKKRAEAYAGPPLSDRIFLETLVDRNPNSFKLRAEEIDRVERSRMGGVHVHSRTQEFRFTNVQPEVALALANWCEAHHIQTKGL